MAFHLCSADGECWRRRGPLRGAMTRKIRQSDGTHPAVFDGAFHVLPGTEVVTELLVLEQQVDVVGAKLFQHLVMACRVFPTSCSVGRSFVARSQPKLTARGRAKL